jgi:hypothetical protein
MEDRIWIGHCAYEGFTRIKMTSESRAVEQAEFWPEDIYFFVDVTTNI